MVGIESEMKLGLCLNEKLTSKWTASRLAYFMTIILQNSQTAAHVEWKVSAVELILQMSYMNKLCLPT